MSDSIITHHSRFTFDDSRQLFRSHTFIGNNRDFLLLTLFTNSARSPHLHSAYYSLRSAVTGFAIAALIVCMLNVTRAISNIAKPQTTKTHQLILVL